MARITDTIFVKMNERFIEWLLTNPHFSRRSVVHTPLKAATALGIGYSISETAKFIFPDDEKFGYFDDIDKKTKDLLSQFSPLAIAHRGGNSPQHLEMSKMASINYVEADVRSYRGKLSVSHGDSPPSPIIDYGLRFLGIDRSVPQVSEIIKASALSNQGLLLDLKEKSADGVIRVVDDHGLSNRTAYTGEWTALDRIAEKTKKTSNLFYAIETQAHLERFIDEQRTRTAQGVSLHFALAKEDIVQTLRTRQVLKVFVYGADYSDEIIPTLEAGADAIISGNLGVLAVWRKKESEPLLV